MTDIDLTEPYACRNGYRAEVIGRGSAFLIGAYIDENGRPWAGAWRLDGRIDAGRDGPLDLVNIEPKPKREPLVRWAVMDRDGAFITSFGTCVDALKFCEVNDTRWTVVELGEVNR